MDKMKMHSPDLSQDNVAKIRALFPDCVTEAADEQGNIRLAVDFDQLRQTLSDHIVEGSQERYRLDWPGKREALLTANAPIAKTLRPCREESVGFDVTQNLLIEGDNLDALKLLQESYLGKVKMIYIDPPYNTGNDFIYSDDFAENSEAFLFRSNQIDESGNRLVANREGNGRFHSDWLSMMYARLRVSKKILSDKGAIFVSIGQEEVAQTYNLLSEVFGERNFVTICTRVAKTGGQKGTHFSPCVDYVIIFAKNIDELPQFREPISQNVIDKVYTSVESEGPRAGERYRAMGLYQAMLDRRANQRYFIKCPDGELVIPPGTTFPEAIDEGSQVAPADGDGVWRWTYGRYKDELASGNIVFIRSDKTSLVNSEGAKAQWNVYYKIWLNDRLRDGQVPGNILEKFQNRHSSAEIKALGIPFDFAKPVELIKFLASLICVERDDIILDFFAGSGSTAQAVFEQNSSDGGARKVILVQLPEVNVEHSEAFKAGYATIADITKERLRRAGSKVVGGKSHPHWNRDVGFRVLKIDSSNMTDVYYRPDEVNQDELFGQVDSVKPDRTGEDLLFQVLIDWGVELTLPINRETLHGKTVYSVDGNALIACFDTGVTDELVKDIAARAPLRAVFRDTSFARDADRINAEQLFRQLSPGTELKAI